MSNRKGIFGKLPGHGDFIRRELPGSFVDTWDEWLQRAVHGSRELVGEPWLDYYLTSPIWRFALTPGVVDEQSWAGILVPSVDSVGRYFPLTMAVPVDGGTNPFALQTAAHDWYRQMSDLAIEALQNALQVDHLLERFPTLSLRVPEDSVSTAADTCFVATDADGIAASYPALLNRLYRHQHASCSLWWCAGSQQLAATTMLSPGLPEPTLYCSMLGAPQLSW